MTLRRKPSPLLGSLFLALTCSIASTHGDLIAYYPFDGSADDASGNANHGDDFDCFDCDAGPFTGYDGIGGAYEFDGQSHVIVPLDINPDVFPQMTVTMWVRPDEFIVDSPGLYKTFGHDDGGWDRTFGLDNREGDYRYAAFTGGAGPGPTDTTGTEVVDDWTFLAAVWDRDAREVRFHANENFVTETMNNTTSVHDSAAIGNLRPDNFNEGWQGFIDEVRIYDTALSIDQVNGIRTGEFLPTVLTSVMHEGQENHDTVGVPAAAGGAAEFLLNEDTFELSWQIEFNDLSGPATAMHLHGPAGVGADAGVIIDIGAISGLTSPSNGSVSLSEDQANALKDGNWYLNVHTTNNGAGEVRGQVLPMSEALWQGGTVAPWDDAANWSNPGTPNLSHTVAINSAGSTLVLGPSANAEMRHLTIGASENGVAELRMRPGQTLSAFEGIEIQNRGRITGAGQLVGPLGIESGGELVVLAGDTFQITGRARPISGRVNALGNLTFDDSVLVATDGQINVTAANLTVPGNGVKDSEGLTNLGTLNLTEAQVIGDIHSPAGSKINVGSNVVFDGLVSGAADFPGTGLVTFIGGFEPGDSPAAVSIGGDVTFGDENRLGIEIGGLTAGDDFDQVNVLGDVELAGILEIRLIDDFEPSLGDEFTIMNFGARNGSRFDMISFPSDIWSLEYRNDAVVVALVPEPTSGIFALLALPCLAHIIRRRSKRCHDVQEAVLCSTRRLWFGAMCVLFFTFVAATCPSVQAELIAHYPFDEDARDSTGNGNDGVPEGDAQPAGVFTGVDGGGGAFSFNGAGHVVIPIDIDPFEIPELSVAMWVKPDQRIVDSPGLYKTFGHDDGGWDRTFGLDSRNGEFRYAAFTGGAGPGPTQTTGAEVTSDWTFLAAIWDTDAQEVTMIVNEESITEPLNETFSVHLETAIGNLRPDNFNEGWVGLIDDVFVFDHLLTNQELDELRAAPSQGSADVSIAPANGDVVFAPAQDITVNSLTLSSENGIAELHVRAGGGTFSSNEQIVIGNNGRLIANGTLSGALNIQAGGQLVVMAGETLDVNGAAVANSGTISVFGNLRFGNSLGNAADGRIHVIGGSIGFPANGIADDIGFINQGQINLTNAAVEGDVHTAVGSSINVVESAIFNGLVSGSGHFPGAGEVVFQGGYQPGDSPARVEFAGNVTFGDDNSLLMEIGGLIPGSEHDQISIAGNANLDGDLVVQLINGYVPGDGASFVIMEYATRSGSFDNVIYPAGDWSITYGDTQLLLIAAGGGGLAGDFNGDGVLTVSDIDDLTSQANSGTNPPAYDLNGDQVVNQDDRVFWVVELANTYFGDSNLDGEFNSSDFVTVFTVGEYEDNVDGNSTWADGDWNGDGDFSSSDLVQAFTLGGFEEGPRVTATVPEPASCLTWFGAAVGLIAVLQKRRFRTTGCSLQR